VSIRDLRFIDGMLTGSPEYKSRLLIYDAGDARTTWISFWKAVALLQCGTTLVFAVPPLWKNEKEPDERLRKATAVLGKSVSLVLSMLHLSISLPCCTPSLRPLCFSKVLSHSYCYLSINAGEV
jgi:hypothetical protein